jgi:hypothetical protein
MEDREKRTTFAYIIVDTMSKVKPAVKEQPDYRKKLWHHLFIMSNYELDVDSPYPLPDHDPRNFKPSHIPYRSNKIAFRPYGSIIEQMIEKVISLNDGEEKDTLIGMIAQQLKRAYLLWNVASCDDETILRHFEHLSNGKLELRDDFKLKSTGAILASNTNNKKKSRNNNGKNNNGNGNGKSNNYKFKNFRKNIK